ncbi:LOW QUALITY PROTEIN: spermatogenesis-associated protein 4 [Menidia menidia]
MTASIFYGECPKKRELLKEVVKWLQSLDLSFEWWHMKSFIFRGSQKRSGIDPDSKTAATSRASVPVLFYLLRFLFNSYLIAEIFSHRYPDFPLHSYDKAALSAKQRNGIPLNCLFQAVQKHYLELMREAIDGKIHCEPKAAELLVEEVCAVLT